MATTETKRNELPAPTEGVLAWLGEPHYEVRPSDSDFAANRSSASIRCWKLSDWESKTWWLIDWDGEWEVAKRRPAYLQVCRVIRRIGAGRFGDPVESRNDRPAIDACVDFGSIKPRVTVSTQGTPELCVYSR